MTDTFKDLKSKIDSKSATVGIIGLGYVGLPLAMAFVERDVRVLGFDVDADKPARLARGESYIKHLGPERVAAMARSGRFEATTDFSRLAEPDAILICVPTPLTPQREPDMTYVTASARQVRAALRPGQLVVLESTTYPGTTDELVRGILDEAGLQCGRDYFLAFSPEREDPGREDFTTVTTPKVVGGVNEASGDLAQALYDLVIARTVRVSSARAAEASKLTENIFRAVNIALVNELKMVYDRMGIDVWEVLDAAETKPFGFMRFNPGPGWGGHCLRGGEWVRVRGLGLNGPVRFEDLFDALKNDQPVAVTPKGLYLHPRGLEALALDPRSGDVAYRPVEVLYRGFYEGSGVCLTTDDNRRLFLTDGHPMLVRNSAGFEIVSARDLQAGKQLPVLSESENPELSFASLRAIETIAMKEPVYSLEVEGVHTFTTTGGIAVHNCIPLDPFYLSWKAREHGESPKFIELAGDVNLRMPHYVVGKLQGALNDRGRAVKGAGVLVLGIAYKRDIDDPRESPAFEIIDLLLHLGADVAYHDPHIPAAPRMRTWPKLPPLESVPLNERTLAATDAVLIVTDHRAVDYAFVAKHAPLVIDTRGLYRVPLPNVVKA
jgi:UDP-N-acetyl-D-mannosaminuronate dehydrogenase